MKRFLVLMLLAGACSTERVSPEPEAESTQSAETRWVRAEPALGLSWLEAPAQVIAAPQATAVVSVPLSARVLRVRVRKGQSVKANDPVVDVLMPELSRAAGALSAAKIRVQAYEERKSRVAPLVEQGLARASELAELDANIALARADAESARATLRAAGVSDQQAASLVTGNGALALRAPVTGMVVDVSAKVGEHREPGAGPLLQIVNTADVQIEARFSRVPPPDVGFEWVTADSSVPLVLDTLSPRVEGQDNARVGWLHVAEGHPIPPAGALGRVRIKPPADWVVVPARAVIESDGKAEVEAKQGERSERVAVKVVLRTNSEAVLSGLALGTLVAADAKRVQEQTP